MPKRYRNWIRKRAYSKRDPLPERQIGFLSLGSPDPAQRCKPKLNEKHYDRRRRNLHNDGIDAA